MKHLILALVACFGLSGCMEGEVYAAPIEPYHTGAIEFCDNYGCRNVDGTYYYDSTGTLFYWDANFNCWVGPSGYWYRGAYHSGFWAGYHAFYGHGYYHGYSGGYHGSFHGNYHSGYHGYHGGSYGHGSGGYHGGGHSGGHGGHR